MAYMKICTNENYPLYGSSIYTVVSQYFGEYNYSTYQNGWHTIFEQGYLLQDKHLLLFKASYSDTLSWSTQCILHKRVGTYVCSLATSITHVIRTVHTYVLSCYHIKLTYFLHSFPSRSLDIFHLISILMKRWGQSFQTLRMTVDSPIQSSKVILKLPNNTL